jgi:pyrroloquinoline quinone biosynthesis protein B
VTGGEWTLVNASPDLRAQIDATPELWPRNGARHSPIRDVILTGAEVDQMLGLLLLREFHCFRVHATRSVRRILTEDNSIFGVLSRFAGQVTWNDLPLDRPTSAGGACVEAVPLPAAYPGFVSSPRAAELNASEAAVGLIVASETGGGSLAFLPGVGCVSEAMLERLAACDYLLFDGTFWSDDEPLHIPGITRSARQMGHLPISGAGGSLDRLAGLKKPRKIFIHINNTNPILDEKSEEHRMVRESGWEIAWDGMEMAL